MFYSHIVNNTNPLKKPVNTLFFSFQSNNFADVLTFPSVLRSIFWNPLFYGISV